jgi:hypothetical protein
MAPSVDGMDDCLFTFVCRVLSEKISRSNLLAAEERAMPLAIRFPGGLVSEGRSM